MTNYTTVTDAMTELTNSGVFDWFDFDAVSEEEVAKWMFKNHATPEQAATHFDAA